MTAEPTTATCSRCGAPCVVRGPGDPAARLMRLASSPAGLCVNCAMTAWLRTTEPLATVLAEKGVDSLLLEPVQKQVAAVLRAGNADAGPGAIDWSTVVRQWDLPPWDA